MSERMVKVPCAGLADMEDQLVASHAVSQNHGRMIQGRSWKTQDLYCEGHFAVSEACIWGYL